MKQYNIKQIGTLTHIVYTSLPVLSIVANFLSLITLYGVWKNDLSTIFPWINLSIFFGIILIFAIITLCLVYMFIYKGYYDFQNEQQFPDDGRLEKLLHKVIKEELNANSKNSVKN